MDNIGNSEVIVCAHQLKKKKKMDRLGEADVQTLADKGFFSLFVCNRANTYDVYVPKRGKGPGWRGHSPGLPAPHKSFGT